MREFEGGYVVIPAISFWRSRPSIGGSPVPDGFTFTSDKAPQLSRTELQQMIGVYPAKDVAA